MSLGHATFAALCAAVLVTAGCSTPSWMPFRSEEGRVVVPENAVQYQCEGNRRFYLRTLGEGAVWLILPDREVRLDRRGGGRTFGNGVSTLTLEGDGAEFNDGPGGAYSGCKPAQATR